jgi:UDP-glucose 4-epimerase
MDEQRPRAHRGRTLQGVPCLVLGAGGFVGTNLCRALQAHGAGVHGFGRRQSYPEALGRIPWTQGDFSDRAALARVVDGHEVIFHLVGGSLPDSSNKDPVADVMGCIVASLHLLEICRASGVRKIVFISSGGTVYGAPSKIPIPETAQTDPISAYGIGKLAVEKYLNLYQHLHGLDYVALRVSNPYGPYQSPTRRQGIVAAVLQKVLDRQEVEIWGTGEVVRDFIFIDDVVDAIIAAAGYNGPHQVFNVGSGVGRTILQIVEDIRLILDCRHIEIVYRPARPVDVPVNVLDTTLIREQIGWAPRIDWVDGLRATSSWLLRSGKPPA